MKRLPLTLLVAGVTAVAGLGIQNVASGAGSKTVTLKDVSFSPKKLSVSKGTTVNFRWNDETTIHNVTSTGAKRFKTISNRSSGSQRRTFSKAGAYRYTCTLHPGMSGQITVR